MENAHIVLDYQPFHRRLIVFVLFIYYLFIYFCHIGLRLVSLALQKVPQVRSQEGGISFLSSRFTCNVCFQTGQKSFNHTDLRVLL